MNPLLKPSAGVCSNVVRLLTIGTFYQIQASRGLSCKSPRCKPQPTADLDIRIELSRGLGDVHELKNAIRKTFFLDEPSIKLFKLTGEEYCGELINAMMKGITYEESLIAKNNCTNEMVGFALNGEYNTENFELEVDKWIVNMKDARNKKVLTLWKSISQHFNFKCVKPSARAMEIFYLGVVPKARQRGLGKKLVKESLKLAKRSGYGIVQVVCTSFNSAAICKSLEMKRACVVEYDSLRMPTDGRPVVTKPPPSPNANVQIYYSTLQSV